MPKLAKVVVPSKSTDLHNFFELWEAVKDLSQVPVHQTKHLHVATFVRKIDRHVSILIPYLEDETDISEVAALVKCE